MCILTLIYIVRHFVMYFRLFERMFEVIYTGQIMCSWTQKYDCEWMILDQHFWTLYQFKISSMFVRIQCDFIPVHEKKMFISVHELNMWHICSWTQNMSVKWNKCYTVQWIMNKLQFFLEQFVFYIHMLSWSWTNDNFSWTIWVLYTYALLIMNKW